MNLARDQASELCFFPLVNKEIQRKVFQKLTTAVSAQADLTGDDVLGPAASKLALRSKATFVTGPLREGDLTWTKVIRQPGCRRN